MRRVWRKKQAAAPSAAAVMHPERDPSSGASRRLLPQGEKEEGSHRVPGSYIPESFVT